MIRKKFVVAPGQHFRSSAAGYLGRPGEVWIVEQVFTGTDALPYARLVSGADPSRHKTLSLAVLSDQRQFLPVAGGKSEGTEAPEVKKPAER